MIPRAADIYTIRALRIDGTTKRFWRCHLVSRNANRLVFFGTFDYGIDHPDLGLIEAGTFSVEYFPFNKWFNVFLFFRPDGSFRNFYCNVSKPFSMKGACLEYTDLDVDVIVWPDGRIEVTDLDDLQKNVRKFGLAADIVEKVNCVADDLVKLANSRRWIFRLLGKTAHLKIAQRYSQHEAANNDRCSRLDGRS
jgi:protein associated with RNAse G/E